MENYYEHLLAPDGNQDFTAYIISMLDDLNYGLVRIKINGKKCKIAGSNWEEPVKDAHIIDFADCFMHYHPLIKEYIASRL